jgi:hypothetical protein
MRWYLATYRFDVIMMICSNRPKPLRLVLTDLVAGLMEK